jgi:hypothetical protein
MGALTPGNVGSGGGAAWTLSTLCVPSWTPETPAGGVSATGREGMASFPACCHPPARADARACPHARAGPLHFERFSDVLTVQNLLRNGCIHFSRMNFDLVVIGNTSTGCARGPAGPGQLGEP